MFPRSPGHPSSCGTAMRRRPFSKHTQMYALHTLELVNNDAQECLLILLFFTSLGNYQRHQGECCQAVATALRQEEDKVDHKVFGAKEVVWGKNVCILHGIFASSSVLLYNVWSFSSFFRKRCASLSSSTRRWTSRRRPSSNPLWPKQRDTSKTSLMGGQTNRLRTFTW